MVFDALLKLFLAGAWLLVLVFEGVKGGHVAILF